jgi:Ca2+-binding EF-hand superfamily protein
MNKWSLIFITVFVLSGIAWAAETSFQEMDKNKDGKLSREEFDQEAVRVFKENDKNNDGALDKSEFSQIKGAQSKFGDLDANKDGKVTMEELRTAAGINFKQLDRKRDNYLTEEDLKCSPRYKPEASPVYGIYF